MDTIYFSFFGIIFVFLYLFNQLKITKIFLTIILSIYIGMELATYPFMEHFLFRPNSLFLEHLHNYQEIFKMVWGMYSFYILLFIPFLFLSIYKIYHFFDKTLKKSDIKSKIITLPFVLIFLLLGVRSSIGESTPNASFYTFSKNDLNNELANNSFISVAYSLYLMKKEKFYDYGNINEKNALNNVKILNNINNKDQTLVRFQKSLFSTKKNIILVVLESFGHEYTGYLGGTPTTPNLDSLRKRSFYFTNMYAVGYRTSWGISSIVSSLYPIPSREYVKASKSQKNFYTIARTLKEQGYSTTFLYSGDANFDNMRGFLAANGYENVYGYETFSHNKKKYTWGYNDEDLYDKTFDLIQQSKKNPFFITLLTLSSHEPFDYPKDKVEAYKKYPLKSFANSIKYSDFALGKFIKKLEKHHILENTVVAFIADHCSKVRGADVPIDQYKIPALIVSSDFKNGGKEYNKIASQIDFAPTILDIAGINAYLPTMGSSVLQNQRDSAILIAHKKNFAYLTHNNYIIYKPNQQYKIFDYNKTKIKEKPKEFIDGLSYIYTSKYLYQNHLYK